MNKWLTLTQSLNVYLKGTVQGAKVKYTVKTKMVDCVLFLQWLHFKGQLKVNHSIKSPLNISCSENLKGSGNIFKVITSFFYSLWICIKFVENCLTNLNFEETSRIDLIIISPVILGSVHVGGASAVSSSRGVNKLRALSRCTHRSLLLSLLLTDRQPKDEPQRPFCCIPPPLPFSVSFCTYPLRATFSIPHTFHLLV